jgi:carboxypeptidase C (cathepsin A)
MDADERRWKAILLSAFICVDLRFLRLDARQAMKRIVVWGLGVMLVGSVATAQERHRPPTTDPTVRVATTRETTKPTEKEEKEHEKQTGDELKVTAHSVVVGGKKIEYTATAGTLVQRDEAGNAKADMFFVAYVKGAKAETAGTKPSSQPSPGVPSEGVRGASTRPVTFVFNGGPGAASVWLHLGTAGPKRVKLNEKGLPIGPPYELVENETSWLDATDLVFIDPVGTGYSRPAKGEKGEQFYGVQEDIQSMAAFIRLWTTRYERWLSPKFLAGESYGTTRAAGLSRYLLNRQGISLNGIILISSVLDFQTLRPGGANDLPYALYVPSYAAAAWYHKKLSDDLQKRELPRLVDEVKAWAMSDYWLALAKGEGISDPDKRAIAEKLAGYTGLPVDWILKADLRIDPQRFMKQLLNDQRKMLGRFDARITGFTADPIEAEPEYDPSLAPYLAAYTADFNDYVRRELKFESDLPYEVLSGRVQPWNYGPAGNGYLNVADDLRDAMLQNPQMRVMFCSGWLDLATPFTATDYTIDHMGLVKDLRGNIDKQYYPAGHMMYHEDASRKRLHEDIARFITESMKSESQATEKREEN